MAARTSCSPMPYLDSDSGLISTRTAGSALPLTLTPPTPLSLRQALRNDRIRGIVDLALRQHIRGHGDGHDRKQGAVELAVGGIARQGGGQVGMRGDDGRLYVARRAVDVAIDAEGQLDVRGADAARGGHVIDVRDGAEVPLQRRRDRAGHDFRAGPRQCGRNEDRGHVDARQRRHRQQHERRASAQRDADGQQDGRHRPVDEGGGDVHVAPSTTVPSAGAPADGAPAADVFGPRMRTAMRSKAR